MVVFEIASAWLLIFSQVVFALLIAKSVQYRLSGPYLSSLLVGVVVVFFAAQIVISWGLLLSIPASIPQTIFGLSAIWWCLRHRRGIEFQLGIRRSPKAKKFAVFFAALLSTHVIATGLKSESSVDGLLYHGPALANILQKGSLFGWAEPNEYIYYSDLSMIQAAIQARLTFIPWFDDASQVPYFAILALSMLSLVRLFGELSRLHFLAVFLVMSAPVIWLQPRMLYVDVAYAASVVAFTVLIISLCKEPTRSWWGTVALGVSLASVMATKPTGLLSSALLATVFVFFVVIRTFSSRSGFTPSVIKHTLAVPVLGLLGIVFYLRNLLQFGNPIYPVQLRVGGVEFPGIVSFDVFVENSDLPQPLNRVLSFVSTLLEGAFFGPSKMDYDPRAGGFGYAVWIVVVVAIAVVLPWGKAHNLNSKSQLLSSSSVLVGISMLLVVFQPRPDDTRYVIAPFVLLVLAGLIWSHNWTGRYRTWSAAAMVGLLAINVISTETRFHGGLGSVLFGLSVGQQYQASSPGNPMGVGLDYQWLPQGSMQRIYVESEGGVGPTGMIESTQIMQQPYPLFGHCLCNEVNFSDGRLDGAKLLQLEAEASDWDFILLLSDTAGEFLPEFKEHRELAYIAPIEGFFPIGYLVLSQK
jgi:hypothetical protein